MRPTGAGPQMLDGAGSTSAAMAGYPKVYNIEMDPHENLNIVGLFGWTVGPGLEAVKKYEETLKKYPNPPPANLTKF
jgi:arylsulfatase